jgi:hypothetical protein
MRIVKISLGVVLGLAILIYGYLYVIDHGFKRLNLPGTGLLSKINSPLTKDLTFGAKLNCLSTTKVRSGLKTYIVYDENSYEQADKMIYDWFQESVEAKGGKPLAKMRAEIKLLQLTYNKIMSAELLVEDGTPEQKLLEKEMEIIASLHAALAKFSNMHLQYGNE